MNVANLYLSTQKINLLKKVDNSIFKPCSLVHMLLADPKNQADCDMTGQIMV
jgi:hypothetical protein